MSRLGWNRPTKVDQRDALMSSAFRLLNETKRTRNYGFFYRFWNWFLRLIRKPVVIEENAFKLWKNETQLDQGSYPHCVGFSATHFLNAEPSPNRYDDYWAHDLYYLCKEAEGEPRQENGSTIHVAAKVLQKTNRIGTYVWARTLDDVKNWVLLHGPIVVGTDWYSSMNRTNSEGFVEVSGVVDGGHAYLMTGYDSQTDTFYFQNSWGDNWGIDGKFKMKATEWEKLFDTYAEACATTELPLNLVRK